MFLGYPWNIFETDIHGMSLKYSGNVTSLLLEFAKRSRFVIIISYTFNTKTTFPLRTLIKIISFKVFLECSLNVPKTAAHREHTVNIPRIVRTGWVWFIDIIMRS